jgi:ABC-2 type transport system ATP-binding protein
MWREIMGEIVFAVKDLTKKYKNQTTLSGIDMKIKKGDIYGFVGENGAGKTTLIRILAGMSMPTSGEMFLFGYKDVADVTKQRQRMGGMVESPIFHPNMTASDNLEIVRLQRNISDKTCISEALRMVSLHDTGKKKVRNFSLGMKQRLGLAMALMGKPDFLVFDEPFNGLDRTNIIEFRDLLLKLDRERGVTMLISSHTLYELQQLATCYGFISKGKMIKEISVDALNESCEKFGGLEAYYLALLNGSKV